MRKEDVERWIREHPDEALRIVVEMLSSRELLRIGNRSYLEMFADPQSRFDAGELAKRIMMTDGGAPTAPIDPLTVLRDPSRTFTEFAIIPPSYLVFLYGGKAFAKSGRPENPGEIQFQGADHAEVIQKTIDSVAGTALSAGDWQLVEGGGKVFISPGTYRITRTINLKNNVIVEGVGNATKLIPSTSDPLFRAVNVAGVGLRNLFIYDADKVQTGFAIVLDCVCYSRFENIKMHNVHSGIQIKSTVNPYNTTRQNTFIDIYMDTARGRGIEIQEDVHDNKFVNIFIYGSGEGSGDGIVLDSSLGGTGVGIRGGNQFMNVTVLNMGGAGLRIVDRWEVWFSNAIFDVCDYGIVIEAISKATERLYFVNTWCRTNRNDGLRIAGKEDIKVMNVWFFGELGGNNGYGVSLEYAENIRIFANMSNNGSGDVNYGSGVRNVVMVTHDKVYTEDDAPIKVGNPGAYGDEYQIYHDKARRTVGWYESLTDKFVVKSLDGATLRGAFNDRGGVVIGRVDVGDYGGNFANYTPPPGEEGMMIIAIDTNPSAPGKRLYVYANGQWNYVDLT